MFKNVKVENPVRHLVQVSEGDFECADFRTQKRDLGSGIEMWALSIVLKATEEGIGPLPSSLSTAEELDYGRLAESHRKV